MKEQFKEVRTLRLLALVLFVAQPSFPLHTTPASVEAKAGEHASCVVASPTGRLCALDDTASTSQHPQQLASNVKSINVWYSEDKDPLIIGTVDNYF